jgi:hypothetical protein
MEKKRILLISQPNLFRDSLEYILSNLEDVEITDSLPLDDYTLSRCSGQVNDLILIAEDQSTTQQAIAILSGLLEASPNLPIIRVKLEPNVLVFYNPEALPARVDELIKVIRQVPVSRNE